MFDALSDKLKKALKNLQSLRGQGKLTEEHIDLAMKEIRVALLEADVNFKVVKQFIDTVKEKAIGQNVLQALSPHQQVVKIVFDELVTMLGGEAADVELNAKTNPNVIMIVGLQGSGKTTSTGKIARFLKKERNRTPLLVSVDVYRPAARDQLAIIGEAVSIPVFAMPNVDDPLTLCRAALKDAQQRGFDTLLVDTAGRLHIDDELMTELQQIKNELNPSEVLFVADAMIGQDAVKSASEFHERIGITGVVLTKMDGDARGGAALSVKQVTGQPIKFVGVGEKYEALEPFHPDRVAQRILGMGDVLSLIEKVQAEVDEDEALRLQQRMMENRFSLEDYRSQLRQVKKLGSLDKLMGMLPDSLLKMFGLNFRLTPEQSTLMAQKLKYTEAIIDSMTKEERNNHALLLTNLSRRRRIAKGSGTSVRKVEEILNEYVMMRRMMQQMTRGGLFGGMGGMMPGMGMPGMGMPAPMGMGGGVGNPGGGFGKKKHKHGKKKRR
ncbi:MAG: signal recognition particle protein [Blastocatellia bacterium]|nr:signal recognition particle protein [Blastocatellia bacterium]